MSSETTPRHDIVVIGASVGGVEALRSLARRLPAELPAALFVVIHISPDAPSMMHAILDRESDLHAVQAEDGQAIQHRHIYVARPDHHLLIEPGRMRVVRGPKENRNRPAVDPLFRSAAAAYGPRVVGIVLTGGLNDGTAGLAAIRSLGGVAVVQDPDDALISGMPRSALENVEVDHCLPLAEIPALIERLASTPAGNGGPPPPEMVYESKLAGGDVALSSQESTPGEPALLTCPECNGAMWEIGEGGLLRFRCHVGHAYTAESLLQDEDMALESALWNALRTLKDRARLSRKMASDARRRDLLRYAASHEEAAEQAERDAVLLGELLKRRKTPLVYSDG